MEKEFDKQDSLRVINEMINTARGNLNKGAGKYYLLWGYYIILHMVYQYINLNYLFDPQIGNSNLQTICSVIWILSPIVITVILILRDRKRIRVVTYTDRIVAQTWIGFGICTILLGAISILSHSKTMPFGAIELTIYAYALFISASAYRFRWMYISAAIVEICAISILLVPNFLICTILVIVALVAGNIIPGHILHNKTKRYV